MLWVLTVQPGNVWITSKTRMVLERTQSLPIDPCALSASEDTDFGPRRETQSPPPHTHFSTPHLKHTIVSWMTLRCVPRHSLIPRLLWLICLLQLTLFFTLLSLNFCQPSAQRLLSLIPKRPQDFFGRSGFGERWVDCDEFTSTSAPCYRENLSS